MKLELNLARDANNRKGFYRYVNHKRKVKEVVLPPDNAGKLVTMNEEKAEVLKMFSTKSSTSLPRTLRLMKRRKGIGGSKCDSRMRT